ncbi:hypothetical protein ACSSS7_000012 [Eimeria intestinalis]
MSGNKMYEATIQTGNDEHVGEIESLLLQNSAVEDPWFCESVRISTDSGSVTSFTVKRWIGSPFQSAVIVTLRPSLDTDMSPQDIQCHTRGTDLVSMAPKHMEIFKVRCPMNCAGASFALSEGASIHPGTSAVCAAAELDGVASASGGVLVVTVVGALPEYSPTEPCLGPEKSIHDCTFEEPTPQCRNHSFDVAVKCSNNPPAEPVFGTLRIVDEEGSPVMDGTGRLQVYKTGWGSICDDGWTKESERVSCLQMGYTGIKRGGLSGKSCEDVNGVNMCGPDSEPIHMMCKAAIHAGAMGKDGGEIAVILGHGQKSYFGSAHNGIPSESAEAHSTSVLITRLVNDVKARSDKEEKRKKPKNYAGESALRGLQQRMQQVEQQTAPVLIPPKFQWGAPLDFAGGKGHWRTIVSHSGCGGLLLAVDESGEIVLEHNCNPQTISTGVIPAIDG